MSFPPLSGFATALPSSPGEAQQRAQEVVDRRKELPKALFASTTAGWQGDVIEVKSGQLRSWWHDIDDALSEIEDGSLRGLERAVSGLERLRDVVDDVIRSSHASIARSDRDPR